MTQLTMFDPFALWKSMYDITEESMSQLVNETIHTETFAEWLGQIQSNYLQYQKFLHQTTDTYLKQMNIPTREEISNLASLIINVEEKVDNLDEKVEEELLDYSFSEEVSKLKTSISRLEKKLDLLLQTKESLL